MINQREMEILSILWKASEPMIVTQIIDADPSRKLTQSTVTAVVRKLLNNGMVEVCGVEHSGKVLSRTYKPTMKSKDFILDNILEMYSSIQSIVAPKDLVRIIKERL